MQDNFFPFWGGAVILQQLKKRSLIHFKLLVSIAHPEAVSQQVCGPCSIVFCCHIVNHKCISTQLNAL